MQTVKLVSITQGAGELLGKTAQELIAYTARVSNPTNQMNMETAPKLLAYLIKHQHWSPLEMVSMAVEITTSRAIAQQILRHRSFVFQEHSLRYSEAAGFQTYEARRQDSKNRQNSIDDMSDEDRYWFKNAQHNIQTLANELYKTALEKQIAKEQARFLLPLSTETRLYVSGSARSWVHYLDLRCKKETQLEHREIANTIKEIFCEQFPDIAKAMEWKS